MKYFLCFHTILIFAVNACPSSKRNPEKGNSFFLTNGKILLFKYVQCAYIFQKSFNSVSILHLGIKTTAEPNPNPNPNTNPTTLTTVTNETPESPEPSEPTTVSNQTSNSSKVPFIYYIVAQGVDM